MCHESADVNHESVDMNTPAHVHCDHERFVPAGCNCEVCNPLYVLIAISTYAMHAMDTYLCHYVVHVLFSVTVMHTRPEAVRCCTTQDVIRIRYVPS